MKITATLDVLMRDLPKILAAGVEVVLVEVIKKAPLGNHHVGWHWFALQSEPILHEEIHPDVFNYMVGGEPVAAYGRKFRTEAAARKALSDAILAWAKQQNQ